MYGKPLITNELPAVLDVNKAGVTGFVFPDFISFAKGLNGLPMPDSEEYQRLSCNARLRYVRFFTEEKIVVNKPVPDNAVVAGIPAKVIRLKKA